MITTYTVEYFEGVCVRSSLLSDFENLREVAIPKETLEFEMVKCILHKKNKTGLSLRVVDSYFGITRKFFIYVLSLECESYT